MIEISRRHTRGGRVAGETEAFRLSDLPVGPETRDQDGDKSQGFQVGSELGRRYGIRVPQAITASRDTSHEGVRGRIRVWTGEQRQKREKRVKGGERMWKACGRHVEGERREKKMFIRKGKVRGREHEFEERASDRSPTQQSVTRWYKEGQSRAWVLGWRGGWQAAWNRSVRERERGSLRIIKKEKRT